MLQQTTVAAVIAYYERWMERFPDVGALAEATEEEALSLWQGLGYYRRCRNLLDAAKIVSRNGWPKDLSGWMSLPGVGAYTAGAVCSIALGLRVPAVDGNVERVYARVRGELLHTFQVKDPVDESVTFPVEYRDALPGTFTDEVEVVLEGRLRADGVFEATTLLTKCGSRYEAAPEDLAG